MSQARVTVARVTVGFAVEAEDSDDHVRGLTRELALDLRDVGDVEYIPAQPHPDGKGVGEIVAASLAVVTAVDPAFITALVETTVAFLRRNDGRRGHLRVGEIELTIDKPSDAEVAELISLTRSAIERHRTSSRDR